MAPPGGIPPGLYQKIPPSFQDKKPVPPEFDSNFLIYILLLLYAIGFLATTLYVVQKLFSSYVKLVKSTVAQPPPRQHLLFFSGLATSSLIVVSYYTVRYFQVSYHNWLMWRSYWQLDPDLNHWGLFLKETRVFKEAWEIAIVGNARYWWSHQIFFFAAALSLVLEQQGPSRGIKHTWIFMVLGQLVSYSFATNLFILSLMTSPTISISATNTERRATLLGPWIVNLVAIITTEWCALLLSDQLYWHSKDFVPVLLVPHCALMIVPLARNVLPTTYFNPGDSQLSGRAYKCLWLGTVTGGVAVWLKVTLAAVRYSGVHGILIELTEHPAVSMVAFDVIFCWISWVSWGLLRRGGLYTVPRSEQKSTEHEWNGITSNSTALASNDIVHMRRR